MKIIYTFYGKLLLYFYFLTYSDKIRCWHYYYCCLLYMIFFILNTKESVLFQSKTNFHFTIINFILNTKNRLRALYDKILSGFININLFQWQLNTKHTLDIEGWGFPTEYRVLLAKGYVSDTGSWELPSEGYMLKTEDWGLPTKD